MKTIGRRSWLLLRLVTLTLASAGCDPAPEDPSAGQAESVASAAFGGGGCGNAVPGAPRAIRLSLLNDYPDDLHRSVLVDWDPPLDVLLGTNCDPILGYSAWVSDVTYSADSPYSEWALSAPTGYYAYRGHSYRFKVRARNRWGWGPFKVSSVIAVPN